MMSFNAVRNRSCCRSALGFAITRSPRSRRGKSNHKTRRGEIENARKPGSKQNFSAKLKTYPPPKNAYESTCCVLGVLHAVPVLSSAPEGDGEGARDLVRNDPRSLRHPHPKPTGWCSDEPLQLCLFVRPPRPGHQRRCRGDTLLPGDRTNLVALVQCGSARWNIENENLNVLKNNGYPHRASRAWLKDAGERPGRP